MYKIIQSDIYAALKYLDNNSIDIAITSPPYWSQRNYGFDKQIGSESTYMEFISRLVYLFNILKDKLSNKGVFFLNIGDKYLKKYGKTPLGLIPYKLAYFMQKHGWVINDTIIWYKPNRMPSSVKNRFVNSYEPIFILSKNKSNYFTDCVDENLDYTNIIDINLQPTPYKHVAVYPEKLVYRLLDFVKIDKNYTILDPFAGSGTTLKVINDRNKSKSKQYKANGIMIEYNPEYIDIMKERTKLKTIKTVKLDYIKYNYPILGEPDFEEVISLKNTHSKRIIQNINIFNNIDDFYSALKTIADKEYINNFKKDKILFLGIKNYSIKDIYNISLLKGWVIRNMLVVREKKWYPIFMLIHDNKSHRYSFNYRVLSLTHKSKKQIVYHSKNFIGYRVENNIQKQKIKGVIIEIIEKYKDGLPKYVKVLWENNLLTKEFVINDIEKINSNIKLFQYNGYVSVKELKEIIKVDNAIKEISTTYNTNLISDMAEKKSKRNQYNGKFNGIERKNWGASPGARSSLEEEFFVVQRLYNVNQNLIADYLNYIRKKKNLTKKAFTMLFPKKYKHTVGHWLRKDFGGSIPVKEDWVLLEKNFDIDVNIKNYVCKTGLKLQTISKTKYKIPDDVIDKGLIHKLKLLNLTEQGNS